MHSIAMPLSFGCRSPPATWRVSVDRLCAARPSAQWHPRTPHAVCSKFSTTSAKHYPRDGNKNRGLSALRRSGLRPRQTLSVRDHPLPKPVLDPPGKRLETVEDHGLWEFFNKERRVMATPEEDSAYGRAWKVEELRGKSWEDLHSLWWVCVKERNRIATESFERKRLDAGYGDHEAAGRVKEIKATQKAIKHVLTERYYAWQDACKAAKNDAEIKFRPRQRALYLGSPIEINPFEDDLDQPYKDAQNHVQSHDNAPNQFAEEGQREGFMEEKPRKA